MRQDEEQGSQPEESPLGIVSVGVVMCAGVEQADGRACRARGYHQYLKRRKHRVERKRATLNPDCLPAYNRFCGWET
jgi:hypothetical protein